MKKQITILTMISLFSLSGLVHAQIPADSLVGYWPFNNNAIDESGNGNDGVNTGAEIVPDRFGNDSSAYYFNSNDYILVSSDNFPNSLNQQYTFSVWCKPDSSVWTGGWRTLMFLGQNSSNAGTQLEYQHPAVDQYRLFHGTYGNGLDSTKNGNIFNEWNHIVATYDGSIRKTYLNGELFGYDSYSSLNITNMTLQIGRREHSFLGFIDDIRIYNRSLNDSEITALYKENICSNTVINDTLYYFVSNIEFQPESPKVYWESTDSLTTQMGNCDSVVNHYSKYIFDTNYYTDTITTEVFDTTYVTVYDSISVTDTLIIDVLITGLTPPNNVNTIKVYPNPASDYVVINTGVYNQMPDYNLKIFNTLGQTVFENLINQEEFQINVNDFGGYGTYFIKIFDDQGTLLDTRKLILQ